MHFFTRKLQFAALFLMVFSTNLLWGQVNANFSATPTTGCAPVFVQFQDLSTSTAGNIVSWSWSLGGTNSTSPSPGKAFTTGGNYTICLTVTDNQGNTDTHCKNNYLTIFNKPNALFTATPTTGCAPLQVQFSDISLPNGSPITLRQWAFGNGNTATGATPTTTYNNSGNYNVTLSVTNANGCSDVKTVNNFVQAQQLNVTVDFNTANARNWCSVPRAVTFVNLTPTNPNFQYLWDFGDGNGSTAANPTHTYQSYGNFNVTLTVTDVTTGCSKVRTKPNYISILNQLSFSYSDSVGCSPLTVSFTNTTPLNNMTGFNWDFGDGNTSNQQNPTHTYTQPGCYFVTFTASRFGCVNSVTSLNCMQVNPLPAASYTTNGNLNSCTFPHALTFNATSNTAGTTWSWDFGDGSTSSVQNPSHTYTAYGTFPVRLVATSPQGCASVIVTDTVRIQPVVAQFSSDVTSGCSPLTVNFTDGSTSLFPITTWNWTITDGTFTTTSSLQNPSIILTDTSQYDVTLVVTDAQGCTDNISLTDEIAVGIPPNLSFHALDTVVCVDADVFFINTSDSFADEWEWQFGDGGTSVADDPTYMYADTGSYTVTLTANQNGCESELELTDYIEVQPAKAAFSINRVCNDPYTIEFVNSSIVAHHYFWDFGVTTTTTDTSSLENPTFTYPQRGSYAVTLTAFNDSTGCSHDFILTVLITDPISNFSFSQDTGCAPLNIQVISNSTDAATYLWNAPGATINDPTLETPIIRYTNAGVYGYIELIVTDVNNCTDTLIITDSIKVYDVYPNFTAIPNGVCRGDVTTFNNQSTTSDGIITNYFWNLGLGITSTQTTPTMQYPILGNFTISLTATNSLGCVKTETKNDYLRVTYPRPRFTVNDTLVCPYDAVQFNNISQGTGLTYLWDFGDGSTSTDAEPTHAYANEGYYTVCVTATDVSGCDSTVCLTNVVRVTRPMANFIADTTFATCPVLAVNFFDSSFNAVSWQWDFGDSIGTSTAQNPSYIYPSSGSYDVTLIVTSPTGCRDTLIRPDYIVIDGPYGDFSFTPDTACPNTVITYTGYGYNTAKYIWDFGNGDFVINNSTDTINTVTYSYPIGGNFYPLLILQGGQGCLEIIPTTTSLWIDDIYGAIVASDTALCDAGTVSFQAILSSTSLPIDSFVWDFGGVAPISNDTFPVVNYTTPGIYTVTLSVFNAECENSTTQRITVGRTPNAAFLASPLTGCNPHPVTFLSTSTVSNSYPTDTIAQWLWDFGYQSSTGTGSNPTFIYPDTGTFNVQFIALTEAGCSDTAATTIRVNLTPTVDAGEDKTMCQQSAVFLDGSASTPLQWSPSIWLSCTTCNQPVASPLITTSYVLTATSPEGCVARDTAVVTVLPFTAPQITISEDTTICEGSTVQLLVGGGTSVLQYSWDTSRIGLSCYNNCNNPFANPTDTTTYIAYLTSPEGCVSWDSVTVNVVNESQNIVGGDRAICQGDSLQLFASIGTNPVWSPAEAISCIFCPDPLVFPLQDKTYYIATQTPRGCIIRDTITVAVIDPASVSAGEDLGTCPGNSLQLNGTGVGNITWTGDNSISDSTILNPTITPTQTTDYILTVVNGNCVLTDTTTLYLVSSATLEDGEFTICANTPTSIEVEGFALNYEWSPTTGLDNPTSPNTIADLTETTVFTVTGTIPNCPSDQATVTVNVLDVTAIVERPIQNVFGGQPAPILLNEAANDPNLSFLWSPNLGISCADCPNPVVTISNDITYFVQITDNENGCVGTDSIQIKTVSNCGTDLIVVPNAFSPNGDGLNDVLYVRGSTVTEIFYFRIYSRSGELVFETTNLSQGWDGTFRGQPLNAGVFVYYVEAPCALNGSPILKKGNVTLIR